MSVRPTKTIDLSRFGQAGQTITVAPLSYRKRFELQDKITVNCVQMDAEGKGKTIPKAGWIQLTQILAYITQAPFQPDVESFLNYCDILDRNDFGSAEALVKELREAVKEVESQLSPFGASEAQATETSE